MKGILKGPMKELYNHFQEPGNMSRLFKMYVAFTTHLKVL